MMCCVIIKDVVKDGLRIFPAITHNIIINNKRNSIFPLYFLPLADCFTYFISSFWYTLYSKTKNQSYYHINYSSLNLSTMLFLQHVDKRLPELIHRSLQSQQSGKSSVHKDSEKRHNPQFLCHLRRKICDQISDCQYEKCDDTCIIQPLIYQHFINLLFRHTDAFHHCKFVSSCIQTNKHDVDKVDDTNQHQNNADSCG